MTSEHTEHNPADTASNGPVIDEYDVTVKELLQTVTPPFTPSQRTTIVTDIANHQQELRNGRGEEFSDQEWYDFLSSLTEATDQELIKRWEPVGEWVLSRNDIPLPENDPIALTLAEESTDDIQPPNAVLKHQLYKRMDDQLSADYGFLSEQTYHHDSHV